MDPIGPKANASVDRRIAPVAPVSAVAASPATAHADEVRTQLQTLVQPAAIEPPVDRERVARIRKAIQDGSFPLVPSTVADRLLALKLEWKPHDEA